jgi:small subunit ribosomal protein S6
MRPYEVMVILEPSLEESAVQGLVNRVTAPLATSGAAVTRVDKWGRRRFAYEIGHRSEGYYVLLELAAEPVAVEELDRSLRLADEVIRHKIVRVPEGRSGRASPPRAAALAASRSEQDT